MTIRFEQASRTFGAQIVFQDLNLEIEDGSRWAILGANGSGKSTFLKCLYGALSLSKGKLKYLSDGQELIPIEAARKIGYSAPYLELIEELPAGELLDTIAKFRPWRASWNKQSILAACLLDHAENKRVADFSSGMKQRLRLGIALCSDTDLIILDEPASNLDRDGLSWYQNFLSEELADRSLIVGTNYSDEEAFLCNRQLRISDYQ